MFLIILLALGTRGVLAGEPRGGFFLLDGPPAGGVVNGGTVLIDWRDLEPVEGQFEERIITDPDYTFIAWQDSWQKFHDTGTRTGVTPRHSAAYYLRDAARSGNKVRFKLRVTEGAVPLWLYGGEDVNGVSPSSYGTLCHKGYAWEPLPECDPNKAIVLAMDYPLYSDDYIKNREPSSEPVWWNHYFQDYYINVLRKISEKLNEPIKGAENYKLKDGVEFIEASLGSYGEMILYGKSDTGQCDTLNQRFFRNAGYTNTVYATAVNKLIDAYVRVFNAGLNLPIAISLGNGLYAGGGCEDVDNTPPVLTQVLPPTMEKFGSRVYLKFAGFPNRNVDMPHFCATRPPKTRCVYETFGGITQWGGQYLGGWPWGNDESKLETILRYAVTDGAYIVMIWWGDMRAITSGGYTNLLGAYDAVFPLLRQNGAIDTQAAPALPPEGDVGPQSLNLKKGINLISWLSSYPANKNLSTIPASCNSVSFKEGSLWKGVGVFSTGGKYYIDCSSDSLWEL